MCEKTSEIDSETTLQKGKRLEWVMI